MSSTSEHNIIREGSAEILVKPGESIFYNPVQEFNRDLSVAVLKLCVNKYLSQEKQEKKNVKVDVNDSENGKTMSHKPIRVLEALSATGLRSIRYAKEVPGLTEIVANDISATAAANIKSNITYNGVQDLVTVSHNDACDVMFGSRHSSKRFDAVDLDPYGSPSVFLDTAVQSVVDGGVLLVTCTDMAVLCGNTPNTCYVKYGAVSLRNKACHEMALRIVLQNIESHATRYKRYIVPLLSISADFYVRVFVRLFTSSVACKNTTSKLSMVYQCIGCETLTLQPLGLTKSRQDSNGKDMPPRYILPHAPVVKDCCSHCGSKHRLGGPIWSAPIHDPIFVSELAEVVKGSDLGTQKRLEGVLSVVQEELHDVPLYYALDRICSIVHASSMSMMTYRSALLNAGYRVSYSHACRTSIKTDAPISVVWDIVRAWTKTHPVSEKKLASDPVAKFILETANETNIDFTQRRDANPLSRTLKLVRYQENPSRYWGPGTRAVVNTEPTDKRAKNQNRKRKRQPEDSPKKDLKDEDSNIIKA